MYIPYMLMTFLQPQVFICFVLKGQVEAQFSLKRAVALLLSLT